MSEAIKAIETEYAGCRFRSRLEARWAVFFDRMGIDWEYEPQGFVVGGRSYLPDFRLTDGGTWIEVKGREKDLDRNLMHAAVLHLPPADPGLPVLVIVGPIPPPPEVGWSWIGFERTNEDGKLVLWSAHWSFTPTSFPQHPLRLGDTSSATNVDAGGPWLEPTADMSTTVNAANYELERGAYRDARSARFEHGESPRPVDPEAR
jgi:hypothetical protein